MAFISLTANLGKPGMVSLLPHMFEGFQEVGNSSFVFKVIDLFHYFIFIQGVGEASESLSHIAFLVSQTLSRNSSFQLCVLSCPVFAGENRESRRV